ncbi:U32 family peptidase [Oceanispirochaeta sp. M1]|uniref:U32 family peptidase n=1 Tax=Oceanispirochaeta sp. M1 TaxID=2283433 RepID=UPI00149525C0|nr:U32 family peptidase [Oceanispirochaeta sp. M1]
MELLAPAGTFEIFKGIIESSCDAVYLGGQKLNMRMIRKDFNLSEKELEQAVNMADALGKKVYVTLNSLIDPGEIDSAREYLTVLRDINPHGLIIQDMGILQLIHDMGIIIPLHSSVMMNVHNLDMICSLEQMGVRKVVLSREMTLEQVRSLHQNTDVELEYFSHGDMCVCNGAQCLYSSYLFGMSSNRGRCLKPCRWPFTLKGVEQAPPFPLAVKDLNMINHLGDMIMAGISSFKIEGRMREKDFIVDLVNHYGQAMDAFLDDPLTGSHGGTDILEPFKKRDFSTGYAFGNPGWSNINTLGEGSGKFYSTGKMFSEPTRENKILLDDDSELDIDMESFEGRTTLSVKVDTPNQALSALNGGADRIYLSGEPFHQYNPLSLEEIASLKEACRSRNAELYLTLPRMMKDKQNELFRAWLDRDPQIDGLLVSHLGALSYLDNKKYRLVGDVSLNIYNHMAAKLYINKGLQAWTPSLEMPFDSLLIMASSDEGLSAELLLHGRPAMMYLDHDVSGTKASESILETAAGSMKVLRDYWDRYHLLPAGEFTLLPKLPELLQAGFRNFRLELLDYSSEEVGFLTALFKQALENPSNSRDLFKTMIPKGEGYSYGAQKY